MAARLLASSVDVPAPSARFTDRITRDSTSQPGDGPDRLGRADPAGDLGIGNGLTDRDLLKRLPNPLLERGATHIERQIETEIRCLDKADDTRHQGFILAVGPDQTSLGEAVLKIAH